MDDKRSLGDKLGDMAQEVKLRVEEGAAKVRGDSTGAYEKKMAADATHQKATMENLADKRVRDAEKEMKKDIKDANRSW